MSHESRWLKRGCGWLLALLPLGLHAATADDYAYRYALATDGSSPVWRVELNPAIYAVSPPATQLRDLIVVNAQGEQVPFGPLPPTPMRAQPFLLKADLLPLPASAAGGSGAVRVQRNPDGGIVIEQPATPSSSSETDQWLVDAGQPVRLDHIEIDPAALPGDARFHLAVEASNDLQHWISCSQSSEIVNVRRGTNALAQRTIAIDNGAASRYFRLSLRDGEHAPWNSVQTPSVELHGSIAGTPANVARDAWLDATANGTSATADGGTDYEYALPAAMPVEAAQVILGGANSLTRYSLFEHDGNGVRLLYSGTAMQVGSGVDDTAPVRFAQVRVQHLRLHTESPLAQAPTLRVAWQPDAFVFLAQGSPPYSLLAGSYSARRGDYPMPAALERLRPAHAGADWQPPLAGLGAATAAAGPTALLAPKPPHDWTHTLLWLILVGGALTVAVMAVSLLRQSRNGDDKR